MRKPEHRGSGSPRPDWRSRALLVWVALMGLAYGAMVVRCKAPGLAASLGRVVGP